MVVVKALAVEYSPSQARAAQMLAEFEAEKEVLISVIRWDRGPYVEYVFKTGGYRTGDDIVQVDLL